MALPEKTVMLGQYFLAGIKWTDHEGNPIETYQNDPTTWESSKPNVVTCKNSQENPGFGDCRAIKLGATEIVATGRFDMGTGIQPVSVSQPLVVVEKYTPTGEVILSYGITEPVGRK